MIFPAKQLLLYLLLTSVILAQNSAPSSHFSFRFNNNSSSSILINEVRVPSNGVATYTYYETLGWSGTAGGYAGIQEHPHNNKKPYIFSIWDNPNQSGRIKEVDVGYGTKTEPFGGEGTGLKSMNFVLGWKPDVWYTLVCKAWAVNTHTFYAFFVRDGQSSIWRHLVTMDVNANNAFFNPTSAFIEDWTSTGVNRREINMRNAWKYANNSWEAMEKGYYSVNKRDLEPGGRSYNFRTNWDGGIKEDNTGKYFYMVSGGRSTAPTCDNGTTFTIPRTGETKPSHSPFQTKSFNHSISGSNLILSWERDSTTLPLFKYTLEIFDNKELNGSPLVTKSSNELKRVSDTLNISSLTPQNKTYFLRMKTEDILVNEKIKVISFGNGTSIGQQISSSQKVNFNFYKRNGNAFIQFTATPNNLYTISIHSLNGKILEKRNMRVTEGTPVIKLSERYSSGIYCVEITNQSTIVGRKIIAIDK